MRERGHDVRTASSSSEASEMIGAAPDWADVILIGATAPPTERADLATLVERAGSSAAIVALVHELPASRARAAAPPTIHWALVSDGPSGVVAAIELAERGRRLLGAREEAAAPRERQSSTGFLVVEDQPIEAAVLRAVLSRHRPVTIVDNLRDALALVRGRIWTGLVIDLGLPDGSGLSVLRALRDQGDATPVLVLTATTDKEAINATQHLGAEYVVKPPSPANLERFVSRAIADEALDDSDLTDRLGAVARRYGLSAREMEIVGLAARGAERGQLAKALNVSENTLKAHIRNILRKSDARSYVGLARLLLER